MIRGSGSSSSMATMLVLSLITASAAPTKKVLADSTSRFLGVKGNAQDKVSLVKKRVHDPGYFRNWGVRGDTESDFNSIKGVEKEYDSELDRNFWTGDSMSYDFRILDNLKPTAPMDRLQSLPGQIKDPDDVISQLTGFDPGGFRSPAHIPSYLFPSTFPVVVGTGCNCTVPLKPGQTTPAPPSLAAGTLDIAMYNWNKNWGRLTPVQQDAAKALGWSEETWQDAKVPASSEKQWSQLTPAEQAAAAHFSWVADSWYQRWANMVTRLEPDFVDKLKAARQAAAQWPDPSQKIECVCGKNGKHDQYTWFKTTVLGNGKFSLTPADVSYGSGDYWSPTPKDGLHAPADRLPYTSYPNQAPSDYIRRIPATASEDRIAFKYARYIDQIADSAAECDTVSDACTTDCRPGDAIEAAIGNKRLAATVTKAYVGNAIEVQFSPSHGATQQDGIDCATQAACTPFRFCKPDGPQPCVPVKDVDSHNWAGTLVRSHQCPKGTQVCKTVKMVVSATYAKKDGKTCKANFAKLPPAR
mmetsp:Transcript_89935/g.142093  ORF Transcript_89935/g.142093 Transcript_89935/m.142093 type:complete len:527 (+) Transcript_89935:75-1655(+)